MKFPKAEAEIIALIHNLIAGLSENPNFPSPPFSPSELRNLLDACTSAKDAQIALYASAEQATGTKDLAFEAAIKAAKSVISYAVHAAEGDDAKLSALGWSGRAPNTPLAAPGQPMNLHILRQGRGTVFLVWEQPGEGGAVAYYVIKVRIRNSEEDWTVAGTIIALEIELVNQERGRDLEYCVVAVNRAGESLPSNSVVVVL